jgi:hypothetical protein
VVVAVLVLVTQVVGLMLLLPVVAVAGLLDRDRLVLGTSVDLVVLDWVRLPDCLEMVFLVDQDLVNLQGKQLLFKWFIEPLMVLVAVVAVILVTLLMVVPVVPVVAVAVVLLELVEMVDLVVVAAAVVQVVRPPVVEMVDLVAAAAVLQALMVVVV